MTVVVSAIQFSHDPIVKRQSALNIRRNASRLLPFPEWQRGVTRSAQDSVAAYAIRQAGPGDDVRVRAQFARTDSRLRAIEVRAIQAPVREFPWWLSPISPPHQLPGLDPYSFYLYTYFYQLWLIYVASKSNVLGEVKPRRVDFRADGRTAMELFQLENVRLSSRGVGVHEVAWQWQFRTGPDQPWTDMDITRHRIYSVIDLPTSPWTPFPLDAAATSLPWADALEVACAWAAGAQTEAEAARRITESVWRLGGERFEYGCPIGAMEMYANTPLGIFNCTAFLERVHGGVGNGRYVNCTDCASMVSTLANLLGCNLWQGRMGMYVPSFQTARILAIGTRAWQSPCGLGLGFSFHEVVWEGACTAFEHVWDACLQLDARLFATGFVIPQLPVRMLFGPVGGRHYRDRLTSSLLDEAICEPRPLERRRRFLV